MSGAGDIGKPKDVQEVGEQEQPRHTLSDEGRQRLEALRLGGNMPDKGTSRSGSDDGSGESRKIGESKPADSAKGLDPSETREEGSAQGTTEHKDDSQVDRAGDSVDRSRDSKKGKAGDRESTQRTREQSSPLQGAKEQQSSLLRDQMRDSLDQFLEPDTGKAESARPAQGDRKRQTSLRKRDRDFIQGRGDAVSQADTASRAERPRAQEQPDVTGTQQSTGRDRTQRQDITISPEEQAERSRIFPIANGVAFRHGEVQPAPGEMERWYGGLLEVERKQLLDPASKVTIIASASRTGSESFNQRLTDQRAEAVKEWLVDQGVSAQSIEVLSVGESSAAEEGRPDGRDNAKDRIATIEINNTVDHEGDWIVSATETRENINAGMVTCDKELNDLHRMLVTVAKMPENPVEGKRIVTGILKDCVKGNVHGAMIKGLGMSFVGMFIEVGIANQTGEITKKRVDLYREYARGFGSALDPEYTPQVPTDLTKRAFFELGKAAADKYSRYEQSQLKLALVESYRRDFGVQMEYEGSMFAEALFERMDRQHRFRWKSR